MSPSPLGVFGSLSLTTPSLSASDLPQYPIVLSPTPNLTPIAVLTITMSLSPALCSSQAHARPKTDHAKKQSVKGEHGFSWTLLESQEPDLIQSHSVYVTSHGIIPPAASLGFKSRRLLVQAPVSLSLSLSLTAKPAASLVLTNELLKTQHTRTKWEPPSQKGRGMDSQPTVQEAEQAIYLHKGTPHDNKNCPGDTIPG